MLGGQPVVRDDDAGPGLFGQGAGQRPVAERRPGHVPAAVQVQHGGGCLGLGREQESRHSPGVHRPHADAGRRLELPVQALERDPQLLQVGRADLGEGLPVPGDAGQQLTADRACRADRLVDLAQQAPGPVEQGLARQRELDAVRGPPQQVTSDQPLQAADLAAQRGLRQVQPRGGAAEVQFVGHRDERAQVPQLDGVRRLRQRYDLGVLVVHRPDYRPPGAAVVMPVMHDCHAHSAFPFALVPACQRRGMPRNRIADLQLRGSTSPLPVRVYWPGQAASQPGPLLVFCIVGAGAGAGRGFEPGAELLPQAQRGLRPAGAGRALRLADSRTTG